MESGEGRPAGISLGRALQIAPGFLNDDLRVAVEAIDRVHGDGQLPAIPVMIVSNIGATDERQRDGVFIARRQDPDARLTPSVILVRREAPHRSFVAVHEIGHYLDLAGLPGADVASPDQPELARWRRAVSASRAHRELEQLLESSDTELSDRAAVLLQIEELWARSYAQFVAKRSARLPLLNALHSLRRRQPDAIYYPRQWDDADFRDIEGEIDELFRGIGWIA